MLEFSLGFFFLLFGLAVYTRFIEPLWVEVSHFKRQRKDFPLEKLTILHLTDLHIDGGGLFEQTKLKFARAQILKLPHPADILLVTGDLIESDHGIETAIAFIKSLPAPRLGTFVCLGNHDYVNHDFLHGLFGQSRSILSLDWLPNLRLFLDQTFHNKPLRLDFEYNDVERLISSLHEAGIVVLRNQNHTLKAGDASISLVGLDDLREGKPDSARAVADLPAGVFTLVLAHNPDLMQDPALHQFDAAFCGHVHGGQIRIPFFGPFYTHGSHLPRRQTSGWFTYGTTDTFVSRGFGEGTPLRFNCRPEVSWIEITGES